MTQKTVLTIAGSDSSGGAGIQADIKTMEAFDVYGMSAITALTAQNTLGVQGIFSIEKDFVYKQIAAVCSDIKPDAVKIGMLPNAEVMEAVAAAICEYKLTDIVLDPVLRSTSGTDFSGKRDMEYMKNKLFSCCTLITPNIPELNKLAAMEIDSKEDMIKAAKKLAGEYGCSVLVKGGHCFFDGAKRADDLLCLSKKEQGKSASENDSETETNLIWFEGKRIDNPNTHGTGCTLSSAIAAGLAKGACLEEAVRNAKDYIEKCIMAELNLGGGRGPLYHRINALI